MIIKKMTAYFGALEGRTLTLSEGLNVLYAPNESGKSTWCAFVRTMLYGLDTSQRARAGQAPPDKLKYRPWSGTPMSGSMELETKAGPVTLRRWTERDSRPMQAFSATRTGTDLPAEGLAPDTAGQALTGMPRQVFERSALIRQTSMALTNDPELDKRLGALVSSGDESVSYLETEARLRAWQRRRSGRRGALPALEERLGQTRAQLEDVRRHRRTAAELDEELAALEARRDEEADKTRKTRAARREKALADMLEAQERVTRLAARRDEADRALREAEAALDATPFGRADPDEAAARAKRDAAAAEDLGRAAARPPRVWLAYIPLGLAALAFALAFFLPNAVACAAAGIALTLLFIALHARLRGMERTRRDKLAERARILAVYGAAEPGQLAGLAEEHRALWRAWERAQRERQRLDGELSEAETAHELAQKRALAAAGDDGADRDDADHMRADELRRRRDLAEGQALALGDPMALESELCEDERRREALMEQEASLTLALEALAEADAQLRERFSPALARAAAGLFARMTDGRYDELTLARDLSARARRTGDTVGRELDYLSDGARDQLYLSLRLALCGLLPGQEEDPCPLLLDDALAAFDAGRMARALELLRELSQTRQILLFTCHEREYQYFENGGAACMTLEPFS